MLSATLILITSGLLSRIHLKNIEKFNQNFVSLEIQGCTMETHYKRYRLQSEPNDNRRNHSLVVYLSKLLDSVPMWKLSGCFNLCACFVFTSNETFCKSWLNLFFCKLGLHQLWPFHLLFRSLIISSVFFGKSPSIVHLRVLRVLGEMIYLYNLNMNNIYYLFVST